MSTLLNTGLISKSEITVTAQSRKVTVRAGRHNDKCTSKQDRDQVRAARDGCRHLKWSCTGGDALPRRTSMATCVPFSERRRTRQTKAPVVAAVCFFGGEAVSVSIMHFTEEVQIPAVSPAALQKTASVSPEFKAVLPKIETHCIFVALLGELHWPVRVVVHHVSEILHGLWPDPPAVQGANCLGLLVVDGSTEICHRIFCASPASFFVRHAFCEAPVGLPFFTWRLTESVELLLGHATMGELRVIVNLWQDKDATPFEVRAVGQRPARKGIKSRGFEEG